MRLRQVYSPATEAALNGENGQLRREMLWQTDWLWISDNQWDRERHPDRHDVRATTALEVMWQGAFVRNRGRIRAVGDPHHVGLFNCDDGGRIEHPGHDITYGTTLIPDPGLLSQLLRDRGGVRIRDERNPFPWMSRTVSAATYVRVRHFRAALLRPDTHDPVALEECALELLEDLVADAAGGDPCPVGSGSGGGSVGRRMAEALSYLAASFREPVRLADLASLLRCNPSHASRRFRLETGIPMSRYLAGLRIRHAARLILDGAESLADVALECGFPHHSHLSATFRREVGCAPRDLRRADLRHFATTTLRTRSPSAERRRAK